MSTAITRVDLRYEQDVVSARFLARIIAEQLGFIKSDQTRISTAVSEIARNAFQYAGGGEIEFSIDTDRDPQVFQITIHDHGRGIPHLDEVLEGRFASKTGMGLGIISSKRLMDHFHIDTQPGGTTVFLGKNLPVTTPRVTPALLTHIADVLAKTATHNPFEEIRLQNQDLIRLLEELRQRQEELINVNRELEDTNRGVVALYTELDDKAVSLIRANKALRESEEKFRGIFDTINDGIHIHEIEPDGMPGKFIEVNEVACRMLQYTREELLELGPRDIVSGDHSRPLFQIIGELSATGHAIFETGHRRKDGTIVPVEINAHVVSLLGRRITVSAIRDMTDRKRNEEELKRSATLLNDVSEMAQVGGWELDIATKEIRWTQETYRIHEVAGDEKIDMPKAILFYDLPGRSTMEVAVQHCIEMEEPFDLDLPLTSARGKHLWIRAMGRAVNDGGKVVKVTGTFQDITTRKAADETIRTFGENLERQVTERTADLSDSNLKLMTEMGIRLGAEKQLTKTVGEKEALLREIHHRVKNNLQIIISLLNLQSRSMTDEVTLSAFRESQNRVKVMALVHEKLYQSENLSKIELNDYLKFLGNSLFQFFGVSGKGITLSLDIRDISLAIDTAIPIGLIINELISNSLKYAFPNGRKGEVSLAIQREDHTLTILFRDNGVGIPEDFDWRNAESLGLRLVIILVDQLDGTIELDRRAGTAFTIIAKEKV